MTNKFKYWLYRRQWDIAPYILPAFPVHLDIELTSRCNLSCSICPHSIIPKTFPIGDMPFEMAIDVLKQGAGKAKSVKFNWRGEPFLYKDLPGVINYAKQSGYVDIMLNTNGMVIWDKIKNAITAGLTSLIFSIDAPNKQEYEAMRPGSKFEKVMINLQLACDCKRDYPNLRMGVQARVKVATPAIIQRFQAILPQGCDLKIAPATWRTDAIKKPEGLKRKNCLMPWRRLLIDWQGNVYPCCCQWNAKYPSYGNINNKTLKEIWGGNKLNNLRKRLKEGKFENECTKCFSRESYRWA